MDTDVLCLMPNKPNTIHHSLTGLFFVFTRVNRMSSEISYHTCIPCMYVPENTSQMLALTRHFNVKIKTNN